MPTQIDVDTVVGIAAMIETRNSNEIVVEVEAEVLTGTATAARDAQTVKSIIETTGIMRGRGDRIGLITIPTEDKSSWPQVTVFLSVYCGVPIQEKRTIKRG